MKKDLGKKLSFAPETVRALVEHELHAVAGGAMQGCSEGTTKCISTGSIDKCYSHIAVNCR